MAAILLVVADAGALSAGDTYLKGILEGLGHTVTPVSDETAENVSGFDGVVVSESVSGATVGSKYDTVAIPVVTHESVHAVAIRLAASSSSTAGTQVDIDNTAHAIANGPHGAHSGTDTIYSSSQTIQWCEGSTMPAGMTKVASVAASGGANVAAAACESGATLTSSTAPAKRAFIWPQNAATGAITADGENMLKNAYAWAFGGSVPPPPLAFGAEAEAVRTDTSDPMTWTHTPVGTPRGIVVAIVHGTSSTDHVVGVTYGGVAMTRIVRATDTATEAGAAELWFLGGGIPTGPQTVSVDLATATTDDIHGISWSLTGSRDTEVIDFDSISGDAANPTRALQKNGRMGWCVAAMYAGGAAPGGTIQTGNTQSHNHDLGAFYSDSVRETTIDAADHTIGWSTLTSDDLAFVALCVAEVVPRRRILIRSQAVHRGSSW